MHALMRICAITYMTNEVLNDSNTNIGKVELSNGNKKYLNKGHDERRTDPYCAGRA